MIQLLQIDQMLAQCRTQCVDCQMRTNLVSELEQVSQGLFELIDSNLNGIHIVDLHSGVECLATEAGNVQSGLVQPRAGGVTFYGEVHRFRCFPAAMERSSRTQADHAIRYGSGNHGQW